MTAACFIFALGIFNVKPSYTEQSVDVLSKYGSRGSEVTEIQTRLKRWGYYNGSVDGIYGTQTKDAVIAFQKKNGLTADGIAGDRTLAAMGITSSSGSGSSSGKYSQSDVQLLARMISAESRGEPFSGQVAVGAVILKPCGASLLPQHHKRRLLSVRRVYSLNGRSVQRACGGKCIPCGGRGNKRLRPVRRRYILL